MYRWCACLPVVSCFIIAVGEWDHNLSIIRVRILFLVGSRNRSCLSTGYHEVQLVLYLSTGEGDVALMTSGYTIGDSILNFVRKCVVQPRKRIQLSVT